MFYNLYTKRPLNKYTLRNEGIFVVPSKTNFSQFSIKYRAPHLWNSILLDITDITSSETFSLFKSKLKELLLSIDSVKHYF